jgi:hypothetical protein
MAAIPNVFLGRNTYALVMTGQTVAANGTLSDHASGDTTKALLATVEEIEQRYEARTEEINVLQSRRINEVIVESGWRYSITGILFAGDTLVKTTTTNPAIYTLGIADYVKLVLTRAGIVFTFYGLITGYTERIVKGKSGFTMEISPIEIGDYNPAIAAMS